jgi:hypothetical protein
MPSGAERHVLDVARHRQRGEHHVAPRGNLGHGRAGGGAEVGARLDRRRIEVEHDDFVVGVADDVAAHGSAHVADADEADLHCRFPLSGADGQHGVPGGRKEAS